MGSPAVERGVIQQLAPDDHLKKSSGKNSVKL
jgi:hypothetical protein